MRKRKEPLQRYLNYEALKDKDPCPLMYLNIVLAFKELYPGVAEQYAAKDTFSTFKTLKIEEPEKWKEAQQLYSECERNQRIWMSKHGSKVPRRRVAIDTETQYKNQLAALSLKLLDPTEEGDLARGYLCRFSDDETMEKVRVSIENVQNYECSLLGVRCLSTKIPVGPLVIIFKCLTGENDPKRKGSVLEFLLN